MELSISIKDLDQAVALRQKLHTLKKSDRAREILFLNGSFTVSPRVQEIVKTRIRLCAQTPPKVILGALDIGFEKTGEG